MPEYDPDYVKLANGKIVAMTRSVYEQSLENCPAVTSVTPRELVRTRTGYVLGPELKTEPTEKVRPPHIPWYIKIQMRLRGIR